MVRKSIILFTMFAVVLGAVGMPTNVHSCTMKGEDVVAPSCGMCGSEHEIVTDRESEKNPCCEDRMEIRQTDRASSIATGVTVPEPLMLAIFVHSALADETFLSPRNDVPSRSHSPPPDLLKDRTYLFNSSFLI